MLHGGPTTTGAKTAPSREGLPRTPGVPGRLGYLVGNPALVAALWLLDHLPWPPRDQMLPPAAPPRRLLVAMIGNLGDAVIASATLERIAAATPPTELGLLVSPAGAALFRNDPRVRHLHVIDHYWLSRAPVSRREKLRRHAITRRAVIRELRTVGYDAAVDLYHPFPSIAPVLRAAGIPRRVGYASNGCRRFLTHAEPWLPADRHVADYQAALLHFLGIAAPDTLPRPALPALRARSPEPLPARYAVLHTGAGAPTREWPEERWLEVARSLAARGLPVLLTGRGAREAARCARIASAVPAANLADRLDPAELRTVLAGAALLVCLDSFAAHLGSLDAVPSVVLTTGVANPAHWRPLNDKAVVLYSRTPCLPCYDWRGCPAMACIREVTATEVLAAADRLLAPTS